MNGAKPPKIVTDKVYPIDIQVVRLWVGKISEIAVGDTPAVTARMMPSPNCTSMMVDSDTPDAIRLNAG